MDQTLYVIKSVIYGLFKQWPTRADKRNCVFLTLVYFPDFAQCSPELLPKYPTELSLTVSISSLAVAYKNILSPTEYITITKYK